jgi:hypothetical protein
MATYQEIQTRVGQIIIDLPTTVTAQLPTLVNEAMRSIQRQHNFRVMKSTSQLFTTTYQTAALGAVPSNFKSYRGRPVLINQDGSVQQLEVVGHQDEMTRDFGTTAGGEADADLLMGRPRVITMGDPSDVAGTMNFLVGPIPDDLSLYDDGDYRISVPYWKWMPALSASSDENWFTTYADDYLTFQAAAEGFFDDHDVENGTYWQQKAQQRLQEIIISDKQDWAIQRDILIPQPDALRTPLSRPFRFGQRWTRGGL